MELDTIYHLARSLWPVWLIGLFVGITVWVMWPRRKRELEAHAQIPFKNDDPE